jgi:hypothetical protein
MEGARSEGRAEGLAEGEAIGEARGRAKRDAEIARRMAELGSTETEIAKILGA